MTSFWAQNQCASAPVHFKYNDNSLHLTLSLSPGILWCRNFSHVLVVNIIFIHYVYYIICAVHHPCLHQIFTRNEEAEAKVVNASIERAYSNLLVGKVEPNKNHIGEVLPEFPRFLPCNAMFCYTCVENTVKVYRKRVEKKRSIENQHESFYSRLSVSFCLEQSQQQQIKWLNK